MKESSVPRTRAFLAGALMVVGVGAASCSSSTKTAASTSTEPSTTTSIPATPIPPGTVTINGQSVTVPTNVPNQAIPSSTGTGQNVIITDKGMLPHQLFVNSTKPIVFTNLTNKPVSLRPVYGTYFNSGPIQPGGTYTFTPSFTVNIPYVSSTHFKALLTIGAFSVGN